MSKIYDVVIIGAGPAGLFSSYELIENNKDLNILLIDEGKFSKNRDCPMKKTGKCANCNPCSILSGYGGAGTFSDGKLNFIPRLGKSDLYKYMSISAAEELIDYTETIFNKFDMDSKVYPTNMDEALEIKEKIAKAGASLLIIKQKHLGSDHLPRYIENFTNYLKEKGVNVLESCKCLNINKKSELYEVECSLDTFLCKNIIVAPGRTGAKWIEELAVKNKYPYTSQSIEIGVRVETRKEILKDLTDIIYDPAIFIETKTYDDQIRTFCTNPEGFVAKENYYGYICVNGHSLKDVKSNNTNFAFISKVNLTEPVTNTRHMVSLLLKLPIL